MRKKTKSPAKTNGKKPVANRSQSKKLKARRRRRYLIWFLFFIIASIVYLVYLDIKIISKFEGRIWQLPARVYARPLELYEGMTLSSAQLLDELTILNYSSENGGSLESGQYKRSNNSFVRRMASKHRSMRIN